MAFLSTMNLSIVSMVYAGTTVGVREGIRDCSLIMGVFKQVENSLKCVCCCVLCVCCWMGRRLCVRYRLCSWCFEFSLSTTQRVSCVWHGALKVVTFFYLQAFLLDRFLYFGCVDKIHPTLWRV